MRWAGLTNWWEVHHLYSAAIAEQGVGEAQASESPSIRCRQGRGAACEREVSSQEERELLKGRVRRGLAEDVKVLDCFMKHLLSTLGQMLQIQSQQGR